MPLPVLAGTARAQVNFTGAPGQKSWSTHFDYQTSTAFDLGLMAAAFKTEFEASVLALTATQKAMWAVGCDIVNYKFTAYTAPPAVVELSPTTSAFGTNVNGLAPQVAAVCTLRTAFAGPSFRGRQYWGGLGDDAMVLTTGLFSSDLTGAVVALVTPLLSITDSAASVYEMGVLSTVSNGSPRATPLFTEVTSISCNTRPDTQRRRVA